jgi:hypothetical protein
MGADSVCECRVFCEARALRVGKEYPTGRLATNLYLSIQICLILRLRIARTVPSVVYRKTSFRVVSSFLMHAVVRIWAVLHGYLSCSSTVCTFEACTVTTSRVFKHVHPFLPDVICLLFLLPTLAPARPRQRFMDTMAAPAAAKRALHCIDNATANKFHPFMCVGSEASPRWLCWCM